MDKRCLRQIRERGSVMTEKSGKRNVTGEAHERGMILAVAILIAVFMLTMTVPFLFKLSAQNRSTERGQKALSAFNLAEAGIDRALWEMNQFFAVPDGIAWDENMQGTETINSLRGSSGARIGDIEILISPPSETTPVTRLIDSRGKIPYLGELTVDRTVRVNLEQYYKSIFDFGFFADIGFQSSTNVLIDSYNSNFGEYGFDNMHGRQGHIGTNNTADYSFVIERGGEADSSSSELYGNVAAGFGTNPEPNNMTEVISIPSETIFKNGAERMVLSAPFDLPSVDLYSLPPRDMFNSTIDFKPWFSSPPSVEDPLDSSLINAGFNRGTISIDKKTSSVTLTPADSGVYTSFDIPKQKTVYIQGDVALYVTGLDGDSGSFSMNVGSTLEILPDSSLTLILGKTSFTSQNNTFRNDSGVPANFTILGTDQFTAEMSWDNNADTCAAIYIPRASFVPVQGMANIEVYGALICRYMDLKSNLNFHYDEALKDLDGLKGGIPYWKITSWQERRGRY